MKTIFHQTLRTTDASPGRRGLELRCFPSSPGWGAAFFDGWAPERADVIAFTCHIIHTELKLLGIKPGGPRSYTQLPTGVSTLRRPDE